VSPGVGIVLAILVFGIIVGLSTGRLRPFEVALCLITGLLLGGTSMIGGKANDLVDKGYATVRSSAK